MVTALTLPVVIGSAGFAVDVGIWFRESDRLQIAADSAAMAAAYAYFAGDTDLSDLRVVALAQAKAASQDNLIGSLSGAQLAIFNDQAGDPVGVSVTLNSSVDQFFTPALGIGPVPLTAMATAGLKLTPACVLALDTAVANGITVSGSAVVNSPNCSLFSDAAGSSSVYMCGSSSIMAPNLGAVGQISTGCSASVLASATTGQLPLGDPLPVLQPPQPGPCQPQNTFGPGTIQIPPGTYCGGLTINANTQISFLPGTYVIQNGNFKINGDTTIYSASGVTFYLGGTNPGGIDWSGNTSANTVMSAPTSGPYAGILVYQDRSGTATSTITGNTDLVLSGTMYFPDGNFSMIGNSTAGPTNVQSKPGVGINIVAQTVSVTGNATLNTGDPLELGSPGAGAPIALIQ